MGVDGQGEITVLLRRWSGGDEAALGSVLELLYDDLRRIARRHMGGEAAGHTLQPTALVNEACLLLMKQHGVSWQSRGHLQAVASTLMRRVLVDHYRQKASKKRGGAIPKVSLHSQIAASPGIDVDLLALDEALRELHAVYPRKAEVVEMSFFGGLDPEEIARVLDCSRRTVERDWTFAQAWLLRRLSADSKS
ncbi:MAG: sigma-70 family RNA polymerase sigma factor [Acidobacteriota bacterium]